MMDSKIYIQINIHFFGINLKVLTALALNLISLLIMKFVSTLESVIPKTPKMMTFKDGKY